MAFYGATSGEAYIRGIAGERFCVRNSGVSAVVEGVGDHGCEYMTGGTVIVLGMTGRNFAAGMSGGIAYVYDKDGDFHLRCNQDMCYLEPLNKPDEITEVRAMILKHAQYTQSTLAMEILDNWDEMVNRFVKVLPKDYKHILTTFHEVQEEGLGGDDAWLEAFRRVVATEIIT